MLRRDESFSQFRGQVGCVPHDRTHLLAENTLKVMFIDSDSNCESQHVELC
jgi:hypothetical protein